MITSILEFKNSSNFDKWFQNSVIKNNNNEPRICYHGSNNPDIEVFDINNIGKNTGNEGHYGYGIYFSTSIIEAKTYGNNIYECYLKIENPFTGTKEQILQLKNNGISNIDDTVPISIDFASFKESLRNNNILYQFVKDIELNSLKTAWINIRKNNMYADSLNDISDIIEYTTLNNNENEIPDYIFVLLDELNISPKINYDFAHEQSLHWITDLGNNSKEITDVIKKLGYDGIFYGTEIVLFNSNQIKSIHNNGNWDMNNNNIFK